MTTKDLSNPDIRKLKEYLLKNVAVEMEFHSRAAGYSAERLRTIMHAVYAKTKLDLDKEVREKIFSEVRSELIGYGPIQALLEDPYNSEIMVYGPRQVYVEREGVIKDTNVTFLDDDHVMRIINRMLHPLGRRVDIDNPTADARLPDGSRVNVVIPPVSIDGPCITIRKFLKSSHNIDQLIALGSLTIHMAEFLQACVVARLNILITGNTSSGKTTLLNVLSAYIPDSERIITIEDAAELNLKQKYVVRLETKTPNVDNSGEVTTRDLVRNSLRMRPDRIIVGEVRSGEALDMLQAMNTGHDGSLTTLHANTPRDAISRLETMAMMAGLNMPLIAIRKQIASAIDLIVHMDRLPDGTHKVVKISEVPRMEGDIVTLSDLFVFEKSGMETDGTIVGEMKATGLRPIFTPRLEIVGYKLSGEVYGANKDHDY